MGARGSGNQTNHPNRGTGRKTTNESYIIDAVYWSKNVEPGAETITRKVLNQPLTARLTWTHCNYGGQRGWFVCPGCDRRVRKLFWPFDLPQPVWQCRHCHNLTYESTRTSHIPAAIWGRAVRKAAAKLRCPDWWPDRLNYSLPQKPKGMHWATYQQIGVDLKRAERRFWLSGW